MNSDQKKFYNDSKIYFDIIKANGRKYFDEYIRFVSYNVPAQNTKILDIGCETGQSTYFLEERGYSVIGLDGGDKFIEQAKKEFVNQNFVCEDASNMSYESETFDVVASYNTVEHLNKVEESLFEMIRIVKKGAHSC